MNRFLLGTFFIWIGLALAPQMGWAQYTVHHAAVGGSVLVIDDGPFRLMGTVGHSVALPSVLHRAQAQYRAAAGQADALDAALATAGDVPATFGLALNYPNPFNPSTVIGFDLPVAAPVRLTVYNLLGQRVAVLAEGPLPAGRHVARFDGTGLSAGIYLYRLEAADFAATRHMVLLK